MRTTLLAALALSTFSLHARARTFEDRYGREIEAKLIAHTGIASDEVTIATSGREMRVSISIFSDRDQRYIRDWMVQTPASVDYAFNVGTKRVGTVRDYMGARYEIEVANLSRHLVSDISIVYRAYMLEPRAAVRNRDAVEGKAEQQRYIEGTQIVPGPLRYNDTAAILTRSLPQSRGDSGSELLGLIVRLYAPCGKLVYEARDPKVRNIVWDDAAA